MKQLIVISNNEEITNSDIDKIIKIDSHNASSDELKDEINVLNMSGNKYLYVDSLSIEEDDIMSMIDFGASLYEVKDMVSHIFINKNCLNDHLDVDKFTKTVLSYEECIDLINENEGIVADKGLSSNNTFKKTLVELKTEQAKKEREEKEALEREERRIEEEKLQLAQEQNERQLQKQLEEEEERLFKELEKVTNEEISKNKPKQNRTQEIKLSKPPMKKEQIKIINKPKQKTKNNKIKEKVQKKSTVVSKTGYKEPINLVVAITSEEGEKFVSRHIDNPGLVVHLDYFAKSFDPTSIDSLLVSKTYDAKELYDFYAKPTVDGSREMAILCRAHQPYSKYLSVEQIKKVAEIFGDTMPVTFITTEPKKIDNALAVSTQIYHCYNNGYFFHSEINKSGER